MTNGQVNIEARVESLVHKARHYMVTTMGGTAEEATDDEFYRAFSLALREEVMINWTSTLHTINQCRPRTLYYLSMEYMPGRLLENNIFNLHSAELVQKALKKMGRNYNRIIRIERDPGLGNGGLGRLASCLLDSLATKQYPAFAYGLRYQYGIFEQEIWNGMQVERPENWLLTENPWEMRRDPFAVNICYAGQPVPTHNHKGIEVYELVDHDEVRALPYTIPIIGYSESPDYNVVSLRLWTTKESPRNFQLQRYNAGLLDQASENTALTDVLYPNDNNEMGKRVRLKQEYLLASASLQDIMRRYCKSFETMDEFPDKVRIHINDTHPALIVAELMHTLLKDHQFDWGPAFEVVKAVCNYTNHSILRESLEEWNENRLSYLLPRQYRIIQRLNADLCSKVRQKYPKDEDRVRRMSMIQGGQIRMSHLAVYCSHRVNGVAALHTEILKKEIFGDFYEMDPEQFVNVTNGVTQRRWIYLSNPRLSQFLIERIGKGWITDLPQIEEIAKYASDPSSQTEFLNIKKANKRDLIEFIKANCPFHDPHGHAIGFPEPLDEEALFDVQIKRFHEYKRQLMNGLHALMLYNEIKENPNSRKISRQIVIAGKAAPGYVLAKQIVRLICAIERKINLDPDVNKKLRLVFIENYNVSRAEIIIPAADLSQQISCAGMEASGTSNMKLAMNGALTIGTEDGANIEMHQALTDAWWPFGFGHSAAENERLHKTHSYNPWEIYMHHPKIKQAVDALKDRSLASNDDEHAAFSAIFESLLAQNSASDPYFDLNDLPSYYQAQLKVEELYLQPSLWAETAIQNIAHMGRFSTDESIRNYANLIWGLSPCPVDKKELDRVRQQYADHDKCRIF